MKKLYNVEKFSKLIIGDPMYLEDIANGTATSGEKKLIFNGNVRCCEVNKMQITAVDYNSNEVDDVKADDYRVDVCGALNEEIVNIYLQDREYPNQIKESKELGCDSARFSVQVDGRYDEISTGADGYYGNITKYKEYYGYHLVLFFDASLFSFEDVEREMCYLFKAKKINDKITFLKMYKRPGDHDCPYLLYETKDGVQILTNSICKWTTDLENKFLALTEITDEKEIKEKFNELIEEKRNHNCSTFMIDELTEMFERRKNS